MKYTLAVKMVTVLFLLTIVFTHQAFAFQHENSPENLKALMAAIHTATSLEDDKTAAALAAPLFPDEERLRRALKADVSEESVNAILALHKKYRTEIPMAKLLSADPAYKEVMVHGATTEDIAQNAKGTIVFQEFPGGAVSLAQKILRPGVIFYEVEFIRPGSDSGMKFHLFYWDGNGWSMIGPAWRAF